MVMICLFKIAIFELLPANLLSQFTELTAIFPASFQGMGAARPWPQEQFDSLGCREVQQWSRFSVSCPLTQAELGLLSVLCICSSFDVAQFAGSFCYLGGGLSLECPPLHCPQTSPSSSLQLSPLLCFPSRNPSTIYCL